MISTIAVAASGRDTSPGSESEKRARFAGKAVAELGCNLITGGGQGAMAIVARSFCETRFRGGRSIGILPGTATGLSDASLGNITPVSLTAKRGYPNPWIEIPIRTHLDGGNHKSEHSRNVLNAASSDILIVLAGGEGTQAELEIALGLKKPVVAYLSTVDRIGGYEATNLPDGVRIASSESDLFDILQDFLTPFALARPTFANIASVYKVDPTQVHSCSMHFPNTCAIRMSEALDRSVSGIMSKFAESGVNLCPHGFVRGAEDLAAVLRKSDVFGLYDAGFSAPGSAPAGVQGKKGLVAYIQIPDFSGQGHIDLWNGTSPVGSAYWNAATVWFWKLS